MKNDNAKINGRRLRIGAIAAVMTGVAPWATELREYIYSTGHVEADKILEAADAIDLAVDILNEAVEAIRDEIKRMQHDE